jgi:SAM-dependent methyltransferase
MEMRKTSSTQLRPAPRADQDSPSRLPRSWLDAEDASPPIEPARRTFADRAAVYQSAWLARALATSRPPRHVDISAGAAFAAVASAFVPVDFYEFEPLGLDLKNVRAGVLDFDPLPFRANCLASVSTSGILECLEPDDPNPRPDLAAMGELARVVAPDGSLLICLPIGRARDAASGTRAYTFGRVLDAFEGFELEEFSLISDALPDGSPLLNPDPAVADRQEHGVGCFWLRKALTGAG